jgi:glutamate-1-semialdehyde 2,1-aminomutase
MKLDQSRILLEKAKSLIPSAAQTYSKSFRCFCEGAAPAFLEKGEGAVVWDVDGNAYLDFILGLGPVTIGYNDARVNQAILEQMSRGISFSQPHPIEIQLAQKIVEIVPCAQMVKFVKNGSDATTAAVRLARAYTGKDMILCCGYHGFHDWYVGITSNHKGVPKAVRELTQVFAYNDIDSLEGLFRKYENQVAAVILEPVAIEEPKPGFLENIRALCDKNGVVLIFDEVVTGFRIALGGAQGHYRVTPDLCSMGKGVANGMPLSLLAGKKQIMSIIDHGAFVSTTFGGETLSMAAALETIRIMEENNYYEHTWHLGRTWLNCVNDTITRKNAGSFMSTAGLPPHAGVIFKDVGQVSALDFKTLFIQEMAAAGILSLGVNNYCLAHTIQDIQVYCKAVECFVDLCLKAVERNSAENLIKAGRFNPVFQRN